MSVRNFNFNDKSSESSGDSEYYPDSSDMELSLDSDDSSLTGNMIRDIRRWRCGGDNNNNNNNKKDNKKYERKKKSNKDSSNSTNTNKIHNTRSQANKKPSSVIGNSSDSDDSDDSDNHDDIFPKLIRIVMPMFSSHSLDDDEESEEQHKRKSRKRPRPHWAKDLTASEFKNQNKKYIEIRKQNMKPAVSISEILTSNLTFGEQCDMIAKLNALHQLGGFEFITIKATFKKEFNDLKLKRNKPLDFKQQVDINNLKSKLLKSLKLEDNNIPMEDRIMVAKIPLEVKAIIYDKYLQLSVGKSNSDDSKILKWINLSLRIPFEMKKDSIFSALASSNNQHIHPERASRIAHMSAMQYTADMSDILLPPDSPSNENPFSKELQVFEFLHKTRCKLDQELFAMDKAKDKIIEILYNRFINPDSHGNILALVGKPGIGKTMLMEKLSKILELPMEKISMGGVSDSEFITGTRLLYIGSEPGSISKALINMKCSNGILFMDEFDKITEHTRYGSSSIIGTLLPILDFTQNHHWDGDQYFSPIKIDLSHVWFVLSMNDETLVPEVLRDRIDIVHVDGYTTKEKVILANKFLLPEVFKNLRQDMDKYIFEKNAIENVVVHINRTNTSAGSTNERGGVRNIKHFLHSVTSKLSLLRLHALFIHSKMCGKQPPRKKRKHTKKDNGRKDNKKKDGQNLPNIENFLPPEQKKILIKIIKETTEKMFDQNKIFISCDTMMSLKEHLISVPQRDNFMLSNMYL